MSGSELKIGVREGGGPPPGYQWNVFIVDFVFDEAMKFLDESQYAHLSEQFKTLAGHSDPSHSLVVSIEAIDDFHELKDKGGVLGTLNVRVFYYVDKRARSIIVVGANLKKNDGPTPEVVKVRIRRRVRAYMRGAYGRLPSHSTRPKAVAQQGSSEGSG